ncbi:PREDICTED: cysteine-rich tail protein 1 isoform X1 [Dipodomys ordii]|uniref:Cysteine-rich tail protein 1 isoform X1 n=2 Tax=Dipodomys ordii TaxID=10020 RepID=A0A1S3G7P3_DIPOR|nr:PREDICTED: cysteine-rich tail protein 1 isoform X1 [Dipodomys ordii]
MAPGQGAQGRQLAGALAAGGSALQAPRHRERRGLHQACAAASISVSLPIPRAWTMDPHEMVVKNPYTHISIPRAQLRPDLGQQLEEAPSSSSSERQPLPSGCCALEPARLLQPTEAPQPKGAKGAKGAVPDQSPLAWQQPCNPYSSTQRPAGLTYAGTPPVGRGDDIAHHCCCCPCCSCCHCPRFCRCHSCCCVVS